MKNYDEIICKSFFEICCCAPQMILVKLKEILIALKWMWLLKTPLITRISRFFFQWHLSVFAMKLLFLKDQNWLLCQPHFTLFTKTACFFIFCMHTWWWILPTFSKSNFYYSSLFCSNNTFVALKRKKKQTPISSTQHCELNPPPVFWNLHRRLDQWLIRHNIVGGNIIRSHRACNLVRALAFGL